LDKYGGSSLNVCGDGRYKFAGKISRLITTTFIQVGAYWA